MNKQLEAIGRFISTLDERRMGVALLLVMSLFGGMGYACFTLYNEAIDTKNESLKSKDALITRANELLRNADNKIVELSTTVENCKNENKDLKTLLNKKLR